MNFSYSHIWPERCISSHKNLGFLEVFPTATLPDEPAAAAAATLAAIKCVTYLNCFRQ